MASRSPRHRASETFLARQGWSYTWPIKSFIVLTKRKNASSCPRRSSSSVRIKARVFGVAAVECSRRRQPSRMVWLKEDDACTRFFHLKAKGHRRNIFIRKNFIACLKDGAGEYKCSHEDKERLPQPFPEDTGYQRTKRLWAELE
jgi:hypothetical protein